MSNVSLCFIVIMILSGFNNRDLAFKDRNVPPYLIHQPINIADWEVPRTEATAMRNYYNTCTGSRCRTHVAFQINNDVLQEIKKTYGVKKGEWVKARYTATSVGRYRRNRNINAGEERGNVEGYTTLLYKITYETKKKGEQTFATVVRYYDAGTICPPPSGFCD